mgnify:CR=1 FL=1
MKTLCTLCARGGSKGVKNKNIKKIDGKPLIQLTFEQAKEIPEIDQIVLSTDSESIKQPYFNKELKYLESHKDNDFEEPLLVFMPSIGISEIIILPNLVMFAA